MTLTTIGFILFLVCVAAFGLIYYAATVLPSKIASILTHNAENEQTKSLFAKIRQFFYFN